MTAAVALVVGVRPQFVKARDFLENYERLAVSGRLPTLNFRVLDTGQHYSPELRQDALTGPGVSRRPSAPTQHLAPFASGLEWCLEQLSATEQVWSSVVVFGDANPALVGAVAASQSGLPVVHVEAGARRNPIELEHRNGRMVDAVATAFGCVTRTHMANLRAEGINSGVTLLGDLSAPRIMREVQAGRLLALPELDREGALVALHRPMHTSTRVVEACIKGALEIASPVHVLVHPRLADVLPDHIWSDRVVRTEPLSHLEILNLVGAVRVAIADSGGLIREAHYVKTPVVVIRERGGWEELMEAGFNQRAKPTETDVAKAARALLAARPQAHWNTPYYSDDFDDRFCELIGDIQRVGRV